MVSQTFLAVLLASSLACIVTTIGIYVISKYEAWGRKNTAYFMSFAAGVLVSVEGIVTFLLLERGGFGKKKSALYAFLAAAVSTPLGTLVSHPFVDRIARPILGLLLAVSAGALVYVRVICGRPAWSPPTWDGEYPSCLSSWACGSSWSATMVPACGSLSSAGS